MILFDPMISISEILIPSVTNLHSQNEANLTASLGVN